MRRQVFEKGGGGIPFEENLIFYAPLTENDLTDHISGETLRTLSTTFVWNSTHEMYEFNKSYTGGAFFQDIDLSLPFTSNDFSDVECTCVFDFVLTNSADRKYANLVGLAKGFYTSSASHRFPYIWVQHIGTTISANTKYRIAWVLKNSTFSYYVNGQSVLFNYTNKHDNFDYTECNNYVSFCTGNWSGNDGGGCFGNIRIYDRALTAQEVAQL